MPPAPEQPGNDGVVWPTVPGSWPWPPARLGSTEFSLDGAAVPRASVPSLGWSEGAGTGSSFGGTATGQTAAWAAPEPLEVGVGTTTPLSLNQGPGHPLSPAAFGPLRPKDDAIFR